MILNPSRNNASVHLAILPRGTLATWGWAYLRYVTFPAVSTFDNATSGDIEIPFCPYRPFGLPAFRPTSSSTCRVPSDTVVGEMRDKGEGESLKRATAVVRLYTKPSDAKLGPRAQEIVVPLLKPILSR